MLPCDVLPLKRYGLSVLGYAMTRHVLDSRTLREVVWRDLGGEHTPSHTTLHAWTEALGAYAQGRPGGEVPDAQPALAVIAEAISRDRGARAAFEQPVEIDPGRYRSEARKERLEAAARLLRLACTFAPLPDSLTALNRLTRSWGARDGIGFRTGLRCPPIEHVPDLVAADSPPGTEPKEGSCEIRGRSPPGATR
ncbi:MAG: hypothetical protein ACE5EV_03680 [Gaiellales bacterium]